MRIDLNNVSTESLQAATVGLNAVLDDLKDALGEERFRDEFYVKLLGIESVFQNAWYQRERSNEN